MKKDIETRRLTEKRYQHEYYLKTKETRKPRIKVTNARYYKKHKTKIRNKENEYRKRNPTLGPE